MVITHTASPRGVFSSAARLAAALALAASLAFVTTGAQPAQAAGEVLLRVQHSNKCVDTSGLQAGATVVQQTCDGRDSQVFQFVPSGSGNMIRQIESNRCIRATDGGNGSAAPLVLANCDGSSDRVLTSGANDTLVFSHSGNCIDVNGAAVADGALFIQWPCHANPNQRFTVTPIAGPDPEPDPGPAGDPIPDDGLPAQAISASPLVSERTEPLQAGVVGVNKANDTFPQIDIMVAGFTEIGDTIYVGGKFTGVQPNGNAGGTVNQSYLAAFDRNTGAWIDTFRPVLDGNVWDLDVAPDGDLLIGGQFSNVNGAGRTAAFAKLDPITGAVDTDFTVGIRLTGSTRRALVKALDVENGSIYLAGNFTRISGSDGQERNAANLARVDADTGRGDGTFLPNIDGIVFDVDAAGDRVYAAGNFYYVNGTWSVGLGIVQASNAQLVPGLQPFVRTSVNRVDRSYQQGVLEVGNDVWLAGSEHLYQAYRRSDFGLIRSWVSNPYGDAQVIDDLDGVVYMGSHANGDTFLYRDAVRWPGLDGWTSRQPARWLVAFDPATHEQMDWYPQIGTQFGEGGWALFGDSTGCMWAGGDFNRGSFDGNVARYVGGFAKFCATDTVPPEPPTDPNATLSGNGVNLTWTGSEDDRDGRVRYEILKNDRVLASFINITSFRDADGTATDRYFVRARDDAGNYSATTRVFTGAGNDTSRPSTPQDLTAVVEDDGDVTLTWTAATDNIGVVGYYVFDTGERIGDITETTLTISAPEPGPHWYQVRAYDAAGNEGFNTPSVQIIIDGPEPDDTTRPTFPTDLTATIDDDGDVVLTWTASTDNVGVTGYYVTDAGVQIADVVDTTHTVIDPTPGRHWYQVRAYDAAGNESVRTPSAELEIAGPDTTRPTTPADLAGLLEANGDVTLTWTPSTDNIGVVDYLVYRNGAVIDTVTDPTAVIPTPPEGTNWYQVQARDAAGNESFKTSPLAFEVAGPDTARPTTPADLAATIEANGDVTLTWTPSTDNIGVTGYIVYRNNVEIATVTEPTAVIATPAAGDHWYQVRAVDAAGNESFKTPSLRVTIDGPDVTRPSTPQDLAAVIEANGDVTLSWDPSSDDVGVTGYIVTRNNVEIATVTESAAVIATPAAGSHWYQVRAVDAAGNESFKTPPLRVDI
jgi:archaellum component FlaG (FlaF/FlaG flagellin family)